MQTRSRLRQRKDAEALEGEAAEKDAEGAELEALPPAMYASNLAMPMPVMPMMGYFPM